jgi:hypothetical protein
MRLQRWSRVVLWTGLVGISSASAEAQQPPSRSARFHVAVGLGYLNSQDYFTGPGSIALNNGDAAAGVAQAGVRLHRVLELVLTIAHARPEWRLDGLPLVGDISLPGARLWFGDASLRGRLALGRDDKPASVFAQVGPGFARYSVAATLLGNRLEGHATNFALAAGAGADVHITSRLGLELMAKDYIVSFSSVQDLAAFGVEGRRAHTFLLSASLRVGL